MKVAGDDLEHDPSSLVVYLRTAQNKYRGNGRTLVLRISQSYKSFWVGQHLVSEELPSLTVLTGPNGSGKSQFLQAMGNGSVRPEIGVTSEIPLLITSLDLQTIADPSSYISRAQAIRNIRQNALNYQGKPSALGSYLASFRLVTSSQVVAAERAAGRQMAYWSDGDWDRYTPIDDAGRDLFRYSIGAIFSSYNQAKTLNAFARWQSSTGASLEKYLSDDAFMELHGEAPWLVLSRALETIGLPYYFEAPVASIASEYIEPRMIDESTGRSAQIEDLSSGERTLLQIAMSMYSVSQRSDVVARPTTVLLDEPDAALHPSMVRSMLRLISEELIGRLGLSVILTTHSPTTVALVPESALFVVNRTQQPRLTKVTTDQALSKLLIGVPSLSVNSDNRRLVIVEGPTDERVYSAVMGILHSRLTSERSLQFMSSGGSSSADGCAAVIDLVQRLRTNGNVKVWGLIDRDLRPAEPNPHVLFDGTRHSIENVVLDPLSVALLLLRDQNPEILEAAAPHRYVSIKADTASAQKLVDALTTLVSPHGESTTDARSVTYLGGLELSLAPFWLDQRGHDLCERLLKIFPYLKRYAHNNRLLDEVVNSVWGDRPDIIPKATVTLFDRLMTA